MMSSAINNGTNFFKTIYNKKEALTLIEKTAEKDKFDPIKNDSVKMESITDKIKQIRLSVPAFSTAADMLKLAYVEWIKKKMMPLRNDEKTRGKYLEWMKELAASHAPLMDVAEEEMLNKIKFDVKSFNTSDLLSIQDHFAQFFGKDAYACPFVEYLLKDFSIKSPEYRKFIISFILKYIPENQINKNLAETVLFENGSQKLRETAIEILECAVIQEIDNQPRWQELFRDSCLARKLFHCYAKRVSFNWLNFIFSSIREDIVSKKKPFTAQQYADQILSRIRISLLPEESSSSTKAKIQLFRIDTGGRMSDKIPSGLQKILQLIRDKVRAKFPNEEKILNFHMSQLFLNVICHCFRFPQDWGFPYFSLNASPLCKEISPLLQSAANEWEESPPPENTSSVKQTLVKSTTFDSKDRIPSAPTPEALIEGSQSISAYPTTSAEHRKLERTRSKTLNALLLNNEN